MVNSKRKGNTGEREIAALLQDYGYTARRGQQYCGTSGDADVVGLPGIHIEVKRVERLNIHNAMAQSVRDAREGETPVVFHSRNRTPWLVTMTFDDFISFYREWSNDTE
jgi:hypothetical protein